MKRNNRLGIRIVQAVLLVVSIMALSGCGMMQKKLEANDWISLAYAGLESTDHYEFTGSTSIEADGYTAMKPFTFQGKITDHNKLTVQSSSERSQYSHPSQILKQLKLNSAEANILEYGVDPETNLSVVKIEVKEQSEHAKKRWEQHLKDQMKELSAKPIENTAYAKQWQEELNRSQQELDAMLGTLQVTSSSTVTIDTARMLPIKLNENTEFQYERAGKPMKELRRTVLHLYSFDGRSSDAMQR